MQKSNTFYFILLIIFLISHASDLHALNKRQMESAISEALKKIHPRSKVTAKVVSGKKSFTSKTEILDRLSVKIDNVRLGFIKADFVTVIIDKAVIDINSLKKHKVLKLISYKKMSVRTAVSTKNMAESMQNKIKSLGKKNIKAEFKYSPPFVECTFKIPESQLGSDTKGMLVKYLSGSYLEGYTAFKLSAKNNYLYAYPGKVIVNHFLLPGTLVNKFKDTYNPFETISAAKPFRYKINKAELHAKYIVFTD